MKSRVFVLMLALAVVPSMLEAAAQPATPGDAGLTVDDHLAWVLALFDGEAATLSERDVEAHFHTSFLELVSPEEFITTIRQLAGELGPLTLAEDRGTSPNEFVGLFRAASGDGVMISFAIDPESGLMVGFFVTPAPLPDSGATPTGAPGSTPVASPVAMNPVVDDPAAQITQYSELSAIVRSTGVSAVAAVIAGDETALAPLLTAEMATALEQVRVEDILASYTSDQVQMVFAEAGAVFFGQWDGERIDGVMVQGGVPYPFSLVAAGSQGGDLPTGDWSGTIQQAQLDIGVSFGTGDRGELTAALDIPAQGVEDHPLADVAYLPERSLGDLVDERVFVPGGINTSYTADYAWGDALLRIAAGVDIDSGLVTSLQVYPALPLADAGDVPASETTWRTPFAGTWWVFWGGESELHNYHAATPSQRYAYDLVIWKDGATWSGDGSRNEDYWAWGQPVLAPADGTVIVAVNDAEDLPPNAPLAERSASGNPGGNHVVIQTADNEYVFVAHMQEGSVRVRPGDDVRAGDMLGLTGNSGNSSEPHIHIHIQDTPDMLDFQATGIPLRFASAIVDGELQADVIAQQGSFIANP